MNKTMKTRRAVTFAHMTLKFGSCDKNIPQEKHPSTHFSEDRFTFEQMTGHTRNFKIACYTLQGD